MTDEQAGIQAFLLLGGDVGFGDAAALALVDEVLQLGIALGGLGGQRVFGGHGDIGGAEQGVGTGGEDLQGAFGADALLVIGELHLHAAGLADPVALHGLDLLGPAGQAIKGGQQLFRIVGDAEVVHGDLALLDQRTTAPAAAVDDLLVGQYGLVHRVPVHRAVLAVDDALLEQLGEQPLLPAIVVGLAGGDLTGPVDRQTQALQLGVLVGPLGRGHAVLHGGVFGGHAEGVPTHGLQDVLTQHPLVAGNDVTDGVVAHVPHVQLAAGVGEHRQAVELLLARAHGGLEGQILVPEGLGGGFYFAGLIVFLHGRVEGCRGV